MNRVHGARWTCKEGQRGMPRLPEQEDRWREVHRQAKGKDLRAMVRLEEGTKERAEGGKASRGVEDSSACVKLPHRLKRRFHSIRAASASLFTQKEGRERGQESTSMLLTRLRSSGRRLWWRKSSDGGD